MNTLPMVKEKIVTNNAELWIEDDIYMLVHKEDKITSLETVKEQLRIHRELGSRKKMPLLVNITNQKGASPEARNYISNEKVRRTYSAVALLVGSTFSRILGSLTMKIIKPPYPVRMFDTKKQAMDWLQEFK